MSKKILVLGATGQDGSFLVEHLLSKENWSHVLEADSELFKSRFDM